MRIWKVIGVLSVALLIGGCARSPRLASYVSSSISGDEIEAISADATQHLVQVMPPAHTTLLLAPVKSKAGGQLTQILAGHLRASGYGVMEADAQAPVEIVPAAVPLRCLVSRFPDGIVLHLQYQGKQASRLYPRSSDGVLQHAGPFAVREAL